MINGEYLTESNYSCLTLSCFYPSKCRQAMLLPLVMSLSLSFHDTCSNQPPPATSMPTSTWEY